jgi:hypothetical protein
MMRAGSARGDSALSTIWLRGHFSRTRLAFCFLQPLFAFYARAHEPHWYLNEITRTSEGVVPMMPIGIEDGR